jgi:hypothetical protein
MTPKSLTRKLVVGVTGYGNVMSILTKVSTYPENDVSVVVIKGKSPSQANNP